MSVNEKINTLSISYRLKRKWDTCNYIHARKLLIIRRANPTIVIAHHNSQAAEPLEALYARRFAARGYMSLTTNSAFYEINHHNTELVSTDLDRTDDIHGMVFLYPPIHGKQQSNRRITNSSMKKTVL